MGDLLKGLSIPGVADTHTRSCWGKGLDTIVKTAQTALLEIQHENFKKGIYRKTLIVVGWSGNDVHGDYGYQGCTWIHQSRYLRSDADQVAAEWPTKQKARVDKAIDDLVAVKTDETFLTSSSLEMEVMKSTVSHHPTTRPLARDSRSSVTKGSIAFRSSSSQCVDTATTGSTWMIAS